MVTPAKNDGLREQKIELAIMAFLQLHLPLKLSIFSSYNFLNEVEKMPKEPTPRLKLINPSTGEFDWDQSWWENTDILDNYPGILVVTQATLPTDPWVGQHVFDMDSLSLLCWNGSNWVNQSSGFFDYLTAGAGGVSQGDVVYVNSESLLQKAGNDLAEEYAFRVVGISLNNLAEGESGLIKKSGLIRCPDWVLTRGQEYYLGAAGNITETKPDTGFVQVIGVATAVDALSIRISSPFVSPTEIIKSNVSQITIGAEAPADPEANDLWFDIS